MKMHCPSDTLTLDRFFNFLEYGQRDIFDFAGFFFLSLEEY